MRKHRLIYGPVSNETPPSYFKYLKDKFSHARNFQDPVRTPPEKVHQNPLLHQKPCSSPGKNPPPPQNMKEYKKEGTSIESI